MHLLSSLLAVQTEQSMCWGSCTFKSGLEIGVKRGLHNLKLTNLHEVAGAGSLVCSFTRNKLLATGITVLEAAAAAHSCECLSGL